MKLSEIRNIIQTLNWNRHDATGGTREENIRTRLPMILEPLMAKVQALEIPARFVRVNQDKVDALRFAQSSIERWNASQIA